MELKWVISLPTMSNCEAYRIRKGLRVEECHMVPIRHGVKCRKEFDGIKVGEPYLIGFFTPYERALLIWGIEDGKGCELDC